MIYNRKPLPVMHMAGCASLSFDPRGIPVSGSDAQIARGTPVPIVGSSVLAPIGQVVQCVPWPIAPGKSDTPVVIVPTPSPQQWPVDTFARGTSWPTLRIDRHGSAPVTAGRSLPRPTVPKYRHRLRNTVTQRRYMPVSWTLCHIVALFLLCCLTTVSASHDNAENIEPLKGVGDSPTGDSRARAQPGQEGAHRVAMHTHGHGVEQGMVEHEYWDRAALQPVHPLAGLEFESVITDSYRGPGNNDTRRNKELPILLWWSENLFPHFPGETERIDCRLRSCLVTKNKKVKLHKRTKSVIFYGTDFRAYEAPLPRLPHQTWALFHEESPMNNYVLSHLPGISLFTYTATFRRESDYPLSLQWLPDIKYLQHPAVPLTEKNDWRARHGHAAVLYMQSHCDVPSDRDRYVQELMKYIQIDSYGKCLNNRKLPDERLEDTSTATTEDAAFMSFVSKYKFHLAMENALCPDYMTEKLWRPMHLGAIPIYRGSPSVRDWMPDNHSIILVDDFSSPKDLAEFIMSLDADDEAYLRYLEYKKPGGVINQYLLESLKGREWGVNDMTLPNYLNGFECFVCDRENARIAEEIAQRKSGGSASRQVAKYNHMGCPMPVPGFGTTEDVPENDSWKQMWLQDYWQSMDQGEALTSMIRRNETDVGRFWDYMHEIFIRRSKQH